MQPNRKSMKETQYISSDFLTPRDAWDKLSIEEQAAFDRHGKLKKGV